MLEDLYQEVIVDHSKRPRNFRRMTEANRTAEGYNPLCGDKLSLYLEMDGEVVKNVSFVGSGCAISTASASLMTESIRGKTREQAQALLERFHALLTIEGASSRDLGKLVAFSGVREFPARVKCATLAWHTLASALKNTGEVASTETE
jgi:nitrogen fixation protein NifU and related proteins